MTYLEDVIEELQKRYNQCLIDNFYSTERLVEVTTQTGAVTKEIFQLQMETGVQEDSTTKIYYDLNRFNPHYSKAYFRVSVSSMADVFLWAGFKKSFSDPAYDDTETHSALMIRNGNVYFTTGNELGIATGYQNTQLSGIDLTKDFIFKIEGNKISFMPLPQITPYFDTFRILSPSRVWTLKATNSTNPPEDQTHYVMFFISNSTNVNKIATVKHFHYLEQYAD